MTQNHSTQPPNGRPTLQNVGKVLMSAITGWWTRLTRGRLPTLRQLLHAARILTSGERRAVTVSLALMTISLIWIGVNQVSAHLEATPERGGSYREAIVGQPRFINPIFAGSEAANVDLTRLVFSGLFRYNDTLTVVPDIAESYEVGDDGKSYTVRLRDDARWHDGEAVTMRDVLFTFESVVDPDLKSPLAQTFKGVVVEQLDDRTVRFTLRDPYPGFLDALTVGLIPEHVWSNIPTAQWRLADFNLRPVGSGPWQFTTLSKAKDGFLKSYTIERSPTARSGYLDQIVFKFYPDEEAAHAALHSRSVDGMALLGSVESMGSSEARGFTYYDMQFPAVTAIFFNMSQAGPTSDQLVRQALTLAIDRRTLVLEILRDDAAPATRLIPSNASLSDEERNNARGDREAAADLLERIGWKRAEGEAVRANRKGDELKVSFTVVDRQPDRDIAEFVQQSWRAIGIDTKIDLIAPATPTNIHRSTLRPRSYQALLYTVVYGARPDPYPFWHSSQRVDPGLNLSLYSNVDADRAIERVRRAADPAASEAATAELRELLAKDRPAIPLFVPIRHYAVSDRVHGVNTQTVAVPADRFNTVDRWYIETKRDLRWE